MSSPLLSNRLSCHCQYFCPKNPHHKRIVNFINSFDRKNRKQSDIKVKMAKKTLRYCRRFILKCNFHFILSQLKPFWKPLSVNFHLFMHNYLFPNLITSFILLISKKIPHFLSGGFYYLLKRFNAFRNYSSIARAFVGAFI